ncbi:MAG TPA: acyl-CoA thioesterase domain-containing protein [Acidimicrobiales bacterium]|nr:acyl-CoA thioesterase domain-containing protein [Acidimicrobiales bacterium]
MADQSGLRAVLDLEPVGEGRFRADNVDTGFGGVVFGGQLLAQTIVAAATVDPNKEIKSVHTVFARGGSLDQPLDIEVEAMHAGRALASATVTVRQGERLCTRSLCLLSAVEPDLIRHAVDLPPAGAPEDATGRGGEGDFWEVRVVGGVDIADPDAVGPAELLVWSRFPGSEATGVIGQALLAYATDGFLIGTAMRPHRGVGQSMSHVSISTSVLSHTLTFHEPVDAGAWHLLAHQSPYAGRGRSYGRADIFSADGRLVASFVQDNMIRAFPEGQQPGAGARSKF